MTREEFAIFLKKLKAANDNGQDVDTIVKEYEHRNVYFYNDGCIKKILASEKNLTLTTDLINAALNLVGSDRIENPQLVNPYVPGELGYRGIEPDLLLTNDRGNGVPRDRISIDVQHENNDSLYSDRLVLYVARLIQGFAELPPHGTVAQSGTARVFRTANRDTHRGEQVPEAHRTVRW